MLAIDKLEDGLIPLDPHSAAVRVLISALEMCHHKAARWVENIIRAIGGEETRKGLGTRPPGASHPAEAVWHNACMALSAWREGRTDSLADLAIDTVPASRLLACLGERTALKTWQVERVIDKIRSYINWARPGDAPSQDYIWMLLDGAEYRLGYRDDCPEHYQAQTSFWQSTVHTIIRDTDHAQRAEISLALAIDMLMPCHWRFVDNLRVVLDAIGGKLVADRPFAACGRNITLVPIRDEMATVCRTLRLFCGQSTHRHDADEDLLALLGVPTHCKKWLAASLDKTIRLQLNPPADLRRVSALSGPDWIRQ